MDSAIPIAVPPPYKSRRGWLIAFGVIEIMMGCAFLLILGFSAMALLGRAAAKMPTSGLPRGGMLAFLAIEYLVLAAIFFAGGVGSIRCRNWARIFMLVVSGLWLGFGLMTTLVMAFMFPLVMRQQQRRMPPGVQHAILTGMIVGMVLLMVLLPTAFLVFYSRKSVKATCLALQAAEGATPAAGATAGSGLPVPLAILGVWQALGVFAVCGALFMRAGLVFGVVVHGAAALLMMLAISVVSGYAAWSIFRRKLIGWQLALFLAGFGVVNMLVSGLRQPDLLQIYRQMGLDEQAIHLYEQAPQILSVVWVGSIVMLTLLLVFILYTRKYFSADERG